MIVGVVSLLLFRLTMAIFWDYGIFKNKSILVSKGIFFLLEDLKPLLDKEVPMRLVCSTKPSITTLVKRDHIAE